MVAEQLPIEGSWYESPDKEESFVVLAVDDTDGIVEIQYYDGEVEEIDLDSWEELEAEEIEPPEDWVGPYEGLEEDEYDYGESEIKTNEWGEPVE